MGVTINIRPPLLTPLSSNDEMLVTNDAHNLHLAAATSASSFKVPSSMVSPAMSFRIFDSVRTQHIGHDSAHECSLLLSSGRHIFSCQELSGYELLDHRFIFLAVFVC